MIPPTLDAFRKLMQAAAEYASDAHDTMCERHRMSCNCLAMITQYKHLARGEG